MAGKYTDMQKAHYEQDAAKWTVTNKDPVVGSFDEHNSWTDYDEYLFRDVVGEMSEKVLLDFGCGPGRNLVKYNNKFLRLDGVDISTKNIENAKLWLQHNGCKVGNLYSNNGIDLSCIPEGVDYDVVMSTIALQHICVHEIRKGYFEEFFRVLKPGGVFTAQMGFGAGHNSSVSYYDNFYDASGTNSAADTRVDDADQLKSDLYSIGFEDFNHYIRPRGPGDSHNNWIFFNAKKPE